MAFVMFLCLVLSGLVSFSFSDLLTSETKIYCPQHQCMLIDERPCCGNKAGLTPGNPQHVPEFVDVLRDLSVESSSTDAGISTPVFAPIQAGFSFLTSTEFVVPLCSQKFHWVGAEYRALQFSDDFELLDSATEKIIEQNFKTKGGETTNKCPYEGGLRRVFNPYWVQSSLEAPDNSQNLRIASSWSSNTDTGNLINQPFLNSNANPNSINGLDQVSNPENPVSSPIPQDPGKPVTPDWTQPLPAKVASAFDANLDGVSNNGGDCTWSGCGVAPSAQELNSNLFNLGIPVAFRA